MGAAQGLRRSRQCPAGAAGNGRKWTACAASRCVGVAKTHDGTIVTNRVNQMWGTDMTQTVTTDEGKAYVFVAENIAELPFAA